MAGNSTTCSIFLLPSFLVLQLHYIHTHPPHIGRPWNKHMWGYKLCPRT
jgi:hypothetical protein